MTEHVFDPESCFVCGSPGHDECDPACVVCEDTCNASCIKCKDPICTECCVWRDSNVMCSSCVYANDEEHQEYIDSLREDEYGRR